ncbi:MAG: MFS transporter [Pseudomonadota bacterium]
MGILKSLSREQKEAVGLLQVGTFLEYFDLMLYVHMAVLLNELFFPKTDPHTASLIAAFAFCSTFVLRPFGALLFGYIGDRIGRKTTVILTTMMMSVSCVIMANLPTYAQVGISAAWIVTICRIVQGLSSMGEIMGAQVYLTEITKPPVQYPAVSFISVSASLGAVAALGIASLVTTIGFNWRIAFWIGAGVAVVGSIARTRLREAPEFLEKLNTLKNKKKAIIEAKKSNNEPALSGEAALVSEKITVENNDNIEKIGKKTALSFLLIFCGWPLGFYLTYMYFNPALKQSFGYSAEDIIFHNLILALIHFARSLFMCIISYRFHPLKILNYTGKLFLILIIFMPFLLNSATHYYHIFVIQTAIVLFSIGSMPGNAIFVKHFPVLKRVTATSVLSSMTRAVVYILTSFGLVYLTEFFGYYGLWVITLPVTLSYLWAINHYAALEGMQLTKISSLFARKDKDMHLM